MSRTLANVLLSIAVYQSSVVIITVGDFRLSLDETKRLHSLHSGGRYVLHSSEHL